jgi:hypothetical protein
VRSRRTSVRSTDGATTRSACVAASATPEVELSAETSHVVLIAVHELLFIGVHCTVPVVSISTKTGPRPPVSSKVSGSGEPG